LVVAQGKSEIGRRRDVLFNSKVLRIFADIHARREEMRFFGPHTLLLHFIYPMLGLGGYVLIVFSICVFLAFGEESDGMRAKLINKPKHLSNIGDLTTPINQD
jgi:hypothetical protein